MSQSKPGFWASVIMGISQGIAQSAAKSSGESTAGAEEIQQCKHCGQSFVVASSIGYRQSREMFTCDYCFNNGKRDWATDYHDENTF